MKTSAMLMAVAAVAVAAPAAMADAGDWMVRLGTHQVAPKSGNSSVVNVDEAFGVTLSAAYFFTDHVALEVLGALPFKHDINLNANGARVADTKHLPPTVTLQYHFRPDAPVFRPYVGAGLNATLFFSEKTTGALAGSRLSLDNSFGPSVEVGADFRINDKWAINVQARWFDIDTDARLTSAAGVVTDLGSVEIDPVGIGIMVTRRLGTGQ